MNPTINTTSNAGDLWYLDPHRTLPVITPNTWHRRLYLRIRTAGTDATGSLMVVVAAFGMLAALLATGCSGSSANHPVDPPKAREALITALDSWKKGDAPKALQSSATPITVQDLDWLGGFTLVNYEIMNEGNSLDANLSVPVKLTLSGGPARKKMHDKNVYYLVSTSPATTVFRDMFKP